MISKTINRPVLYSILKQDHPILHWGTAEESFLLRSNILEEAIQMMADEFLQVFDGETVQEVQKNINQALTASKHLLSYDKQDLIWFQKSLARMKRVRGAFKD